MQYFQPEVMQVEKVHKQAKKGIQIPNGTPKTGRYWLAQAGRQATEPNKQPKQTPIVEAIMVYVYPKVPTDTLKKDVS